MEAVFASIVLIGLIIFGISLSLNNHRQADALSRLRGKMEAWAVQDLRIKRDRSARQVKVEDPRCWLEETASRALGSAVEILSLDVHRVADTAILKASTAQQLTLYFTTVERWKLLKQQRNPGTRLGRLDSGPLGRNARRLKAYELSILHAGLFFDLEAGQVWSALTGVPMVGERLWMLVRDCS